MHELGLTQDILDVVLSCAQENEAKKVTGISLKIGEITSIDEECMRFYFEVISRDTIASGATVSIEKIPARGRCPQCNSVHHFSSQDFLCPECEIYCLDLTEGQDVSVESIEVD